MKGNTWNNIVKPIVVLGAICLVASAALAAVNEVTAPIIKAQEEAAANEAYFAVLPEADDFEAVTDYQTSNIQAVMKATNGAGWAIQAYGKGFGGDVPVIVGFDANGTIVGIQFLANSETSGYGQKLVDGSEDGISFTQQFIGMSEAPEVGANIDAIAGATVSSKAAASAVTSAMNCFNEVALGQAAVVDEGPVTLSPEEVRAMLAPGAASMTQIDAPEGLTEAWQGDDGSYVLYAEDKGWEYATSPMTIAVGFDANGVITGVWVDASTQTAGIGDVAAGEDYLSQYTGIANEAGLDGVDTVAGSTQSTVGVKKAVRKCVQAIALLNPNAGTGETAASGAASVPADSAASSASTTSEAASVPAASASSAS
ncbi:MAG TPA: FMN-binding protein [Candidatus Fournierella pullicola]|uniref:Ion-translocating oxidoreductase complex subunit G n=1 Tax=Candidatus Allofournierella pullicola TaxID=2838596 RepID=A0A9D1V3S1_9FIRM|nr:FMN-binding protein [Candidatus Fournierella pullicola]